MPFLAHLEELRSRLVRSAIAVGVCFLGTYLFKEELYQGLAQPLKAAMPAGAKLIYTAPAEAFFTYLKISLLAAIVVASPIIFYQFWRFIAPGLYDHERKAVWPFVLVSSVLFMVGSVFCYTMVFPYAFQFFMSFATDDIVPMLSLKSYLSFSATLLFAFGVIFEMPLVLVFLGRIGVVSAKGLKKNRKYAILIMFVAGAMFTPPDVVTQIMMAVPLIILYEISIWMVVATEKKKAERQAAEEAEFTNDEEQ
ncbi:twin-arginine translocase subunit TatC [Desulfoferula mesophila]